MRSRGRPAREAPLGRAAATLVAFAATAAALLAAAPAIGAQADSTRAPAGAQPAPARADSAAGPMTITRPMPLVDSTAAPDTAVPVLDSTVVLPSLVRNLPGGAPADTVGLPDTLGFVIRADAERKSGDLTLAQLLSARRPVWVEAAPGHAPRFGTPRLLDAGTPVVPSPEPMAADRATDRTTLADFTHLSPSGFVLGAPSLATAWSIPETMGAEAFDYVAIDSSLAPGPFRSAGGLLGRPQVLSAAALAMPDPPAPYRVRSALLYRKGAGDLLDTAARFSSPLFAHGVAGSYARHAAGALPPFLSLLSTRYALAVGLTRGGALRSWVEGRLFKMTMEADYPQGYANADVTPPTHARAEWASREAALHALWTGSGLTATASVGAGKAQATQVHYDLGRERWTYPEVRAEVRLSGVLGEAAARVAGEASAPSWTWALEGSGSRRRVELRSDEAEARPVIRSARAGAGIRRSSDRGGFAADAAADFREGDATLVDARLSLWGATERARFRLDAESAHERPTYADLLTPARVDTMTVFDPVPSTLVLTRGGDPALGARALRGVLGAGSWRAGKRVEILAFASARHLTRDFGWDAARLVVGDTAYVTDAARQRGDGWVFHAAAGADAALGPFIARGLAWARGGRHGLSPQAGSPPRVGVDATVGVRASFFQGDLPLALDVTAHAWGPRRGIAAAPAAAIWDARLHTDFGSAGLFATVTNLFDADVPGAVAWIDRDGGAFLPRRSLSAGVVWYILD